MIPVRLSLQNFMCYQDNVPPLPFDAFHVACLCGDNGNGKSALVDALTWALWGKSRARSADELVNIGKNDMEVELEFVVGKQLYRVIRKHLKSSSSRPGQTLLELQVASNNGFKSRASGVLDAQKEIENILRMDYQTFVNSALFLQGHSNEFSIKQPGKRKEVLANILGLYLYDQFEEQAKNQAKDREREAKALNNAIGDITQQLTLKNQCQGELDKVQQEVSVIKKELEIQEAKVIALRREKESLEAKHQYLTELQTRLERARKELAHWEQKAKEYSNKIKQYEQLTAQKEAIEEGYNRFLNFKLLNDQFNEKLVQLHSLREHMGPLEKTIEAAKSQLVTQQEIIKKQISKHETRFAELPRLEEELTQIYHQTLELDRLQEEITRKKEQNQQLLSQIHHLESLSPQLEEEINMLQEKINLLAQSGAHCPLCQTELGTERREQLQTKLKLEKETKSRTLLIKREEAEQKKLECQSTRNELSQREDLANKQRIEKQSQASIIKNRINETKQAATELNEERAKINEIEMCLAEGHYAMSQRQALAKLEEEQNKLGYDESKHHSVQEQLGEFRKYERYKHELDEARLVTDRERTALTEVQGVISNLYGNIKEDEEQRQKLITELAALPDAANKLAEVERRRQTLAEQWHNFFERLASLQAKLRQYDELEDSKREKLKLCHQALQEEKIYEELSEAFGKKGIQALLIEQALPEVEAEANQLLGRMTDNRMMLRLETQRGTKKGETIETLDIKIADELGTRNYEMYSGGEAFRIDIALRIALSKLLVRRSGASLSTLIIDEGFGTQDNSGKEKIVEVLNSIQDYFDKIIVITHLEELRDAFPARINVIKTAQGSTISLS